LYITSRASFSAPCIVASHFPLCAVTFRSPLCRLFLRPRMAEEWHAVLQRDENDGTIGIPNVTDVSP
jgi:hypothetical protein